MKKIKKIKIMNKEIRIMKKEDEKTRGKMDSNESGNQSKTKQTRNINTASKENKTR